MFVYIRFTFIDDDDCNAELWQFRCKYFYYKLDNKTSIRNKTRKVWVINQ